MRKGDTLSAEVVTELPEEKTEEPEEVGWWEKTKMVVSELTGYSDAKALYTGVDESGEKLSGWDKVVKSASLLPVGRIFKVGKVTYKLVKGSKVASKITKGRRVSKSTGNAPVPTKPGGGSNTDDFVNLHSRKHMYDSSSTSTPNRSQYGKDVDVGKLRNETTTNPDKAYSNWPNPNNPNPNKITKYYKEFDGNISTPDTPTGSHRVFDNLDNIDKSSHFPYVSRKK
ncbi:hypothetical protein A374_00160 [Fictibacillus macauensis ZFHKF-1]|uniref:Pre-toxin TG domain-containing protein n=1 Tax=Fictibacillus macauensis ZFHKF-1 TaxID=1196324 RepID=I8UKT2_9BACL|nr:pre-toxin TG domain-containing protein [Fictibacillus macauensis]EIT87438.1 hypothetical protein A374_00160 [Fictibacillus macauensis ZFHKF-1]